MRALWFWVAMVTLFGCKSTPEFTATTDAGTDLDADSDTDSDSDTDTDSDTDLDAGADAGEDGGPDSGSDTDTDTDSDTEPDPCESADDCDEGEACGVESGVCVDIPDPGPEQWIFCWDNLASCDEHDSTWCNYWSPPAWDYADGVQPCDGILEDTCPEYFPAPACCLKNVGEDPCLTETFFP